MLRDVGQATESESNCASGGGVRFLQVARGRVASGELGSDRGDVQARACDFTPTRTEVFEPVLMHARVSSLHRLNRPLGLGRAPPGSFGPRVLSPPMTRTGTTFFFLVYKLRL